MACCGFLEGDSSARTVGPRKGPSMRGHREKISIGIHGCSRGENLRTTKVSEERGYDEADTNLVRREHVGELLRRAGGHRRDRGRSARPRAGRVNETSPENRCGGGRVA